MYNYYLPPELIAKQPASPRDSSRLFVYNTKTNEIIFDYFYHLHKYIPQNSLMVFNKTKVLPARITMTKVSGAKAKVLFLVNELAGSQRDEAKKNIRVFVDRKVQVGERLFFNTKYYVKVISQQEHIFTVQFDFSIEKLFYLLDKSGTMPIPLYIKNSPLDRSQLREKYQTVFAQEKGSAAAPTASLHFTNRLFHKMEDIGIKKEFVTLHVGMGTFAPVTEVQLKQKKLHEEWYEIDKNTMNSIQQAKINGKQLVAVGTTVVRTLESMIRERHSGERSESRIAKDGSWMRSHKGSLTRMTDLFIYPPYEFQLVDYMITNFHLPGSSLMMLVEAFLQYKGAKQSLVDLYNIAIKNNFRFYSFGDGMLIV